MKAKRANTRKTGKRRRSRNRRLTEPLGPRVARTASRCARAVLLISIVPAVAFCIWWTWGAVTTTSLLAIKTINVAGANRVAEDDVIAISGIEPGSNILTFSVPETVERLLADPWIEAAIVERKAPDIVNIEITERTPMALVKLDEMYVMDVSGVVFKKLSLEDEQDLPVITGFTMEELEQNTGGRARGVVDLITVLREKEGFNLDNVSEIHVDPVFGLSLYTLKDGVRLDLGAGNIRAKLASFERILASRGGTLAGIEAMDLGNHRSVVVKFITNVV